MVFEKVQSILAEQLNIDKDKITLESSIINDLGVDSLDVMDLLMAMEEEFDIEIPDDEMGATVGGVVNYIEKEIDLSTNQKSA